ncbi:MAG: RNA polymerase subunit sigma-70 [Actinomycetota bacterium]|nr:RNA polymerase subunit sigma-70 [Actinomycetota bacterium]
MAHTERNQAQTLARARAGDERAFGALTDPYGREIQLHCYRLLGSVQDAEDLRQETLLAAWRGLPGFAGRASVRAWLYRIATNRCLNALRKRGPRERPDGSWPDPQPPAPTRRNEPLWLEPYPDALLEGVPDRGPGPEERYELQEGVALAFVAGLQQLPERQRVVLVLRDVLGFRAGEVADMLQTSSPAVDSALRRARAKLEGAVPRENAPLPAPSERDLVGRYVAAQERGDIDAMVSLLSDDAWLTMPPEPLAYQGPAAISEFLKAVSAGAVGRYRPVLTRANRQPAIAWYLEHAKGSAAHANVLEVITLDDGRISAITVFTDPGLFAVFGLPAQLPD